MSALAMFTVFHNTTITFGKNIVHSNSNKLAGHITCDRTEKWS